MDNNDVGYSSVAWDTYKPGNDDDSSRGENGHNNPYSNNNHNSLFASSDEEDDDDLADITAMAASSTIIPAETSAWADEPLDNEVIDIHGSGVLRSTATTTTTTTSTSGSAGGMSAGSTLNQDRSIFGDEDEDDNDGQVHRVSFYKSVRKKHSKRTNKQHLAWKKGLAQGDVKNYLIPQLTCSNPPFYHALFFCFSLFLVPCPWQSR